MSCIFQWWQKDASDHMTVHLLSEAQRDVLFICPFVSSRSVLPKETYKFIFYSFHRLKITTWTNGKYSDAHSLKTLFYMDVLMWTRSKRMYKTCTNVKQKTPPACLHNSTLNWAYRKFSSQCPFEHVLNSVTLTNKLVWQKGVLWTTFIICCHTKYSQFSAVWRTYLHLSTDPVCPFVSRPIN